MLPVLVGVLAFGLLATVWSALGQLDSAASAGEIARTEAGRPGPSGDTRQSPFGIDCAMFAPEPMITHGPEIGDVRRTRGDRRWVFVEQDGVGGFVLLKPGQPRPRCSASLEPTAAGT